MTKLPLKPVQIFYSYAFEDMELVQRLDRHLASIKQSGMIQTWYDAMIPPGAVREKQVTFHLSKADIILLFISPYFITSDYLYGREMVQALNRMERGEARLIPIILRPTQDWQYAPFGNLQALPRSGKPVLTWKNRDEAFQDIAKGIMQVVDGIQAGRAKTIYWVDEGDRLKNEEMYEEAIAAYNEAIIQGSGAMRAYLGKGDTLQRLSRFEEALSAYNSSLRLDPANVYAALNRALTLYLMGRYGEAVTAYDRVIALYPDNVDALIGRAHVFMKLERYEEALAGFKRAIDIQPTNKNAYIQMGQIYLSLKRYDEAIEELNHSLDLDPNDDEVYLTKGDVLYKAGRYEEALAAYSRSIELQSGKPRSYFWRGEAAAKLQLYREALADYDAALLFAPQKAEAYYAKSKIFRKLGRDEEAAEALERAIQLGFNIQEAQEAEDSPQLFARVELVQMFLLEAGFRFDASSSDVGFMAFPKISVWKRQFHKGLYVRVFFDNALDQQAVQTIYRDAKKHRTEHALVIIDTQPELSAWGEIGILRGELGLRHFVCLPISESLVQEGVASHTEMRQLQKYIHERLGSGFDPYDVSDPVSGALGFFGRQRLTEELLDALRRGQRIGLFGIHKMGKSSVLQELQKRANFPVAYVYLQPHDSSLRIYKQIMANWAMNGRLKYPNFAWQPPQLTSDPQSDFDEATKHLLAYLSTLDEAPPLLGIFLDEIEHIVPYKVGDEKALELYVSVMNTLRGLQLETQGLALMVAGAYSYIARYNYFWGTQKNPMHQVISEKFLPPLDEEDCAYMIRSLGKQMSLNFEENALQTILKMSGSHPYLARQMCSLAYRQSRRMGTVSLNVVEEVVQEFTFNPDPASYFDERGLWGELSKPDKWEPEVAAANHELLLRLARSPLEMTRDELCAGLDKQIVLKAFYALKERNIISAPDNSDYYHITFGLFREWIRAHQLHMDQLEME
jgi:tetratricopeptide (TPR) repeat protein